MGSPKDESMRRNDEGPVEVVLSKGFWIGETQVTQELYQAVMGQNPSRFKGSGKLPVEQVTWDEAQEMINKLNETKSLVDNLGDFRRALPTEAQWEYACRAGTPTATSFGQSLTSTQANFDGNYPYNGAAKGPHEQKTTPVGSYSPNAWGLFDMHGNVWEWCSDWYGDRLVDSTDPVGPKKASSRVVRGGRWDSLGGNCRSSYRDGSMPVHRHECHGFRLAAVRSN